MPAFFGARMWTVWRAFYIVVLIAWCLSIAINYYGTHSDFKQVKALVTSGSMGTYNWIQVAAFLGMLFGVMLVVIIGLAIYADDGSHAKSNSCVVKMLRAAFGICVEICSISVIALSSVYMYLADAGEEETLRGGGWVMVLGTTYLVAVVMDRLLFSPALAYVEFMASPCISAMSKNTIIRHGATHRDSSAYTIYFDRIYPQLPKMHALHSSAVEIEGVSIFDILNKPVELGVDARRTVAARKLVDRLKMKYALSQDTI